MNIGLVTGEYPPMQGGVGDYTREMALAFAQLGHQVRVVTDRRCVLPADQTATYDLQPVVSPHWDALDLLRVRGATVDLDVVNIQYQAAAYGNMRPPVHFLPRVLRVPGVVTFHDLRVPYLFAKAGALRRKAVRALARGAAGVIVTNHEDFIELHAERRIRHLADIPIGSNVAPLPPPGFDRMSWRARRGIGPDDFLLGYFGFLNASKGGETLVRAFADLLNKGAPVRLALVGGRAGSSDATNAAYGDRVEGLATELGVHERILRTGFVPPSETSAALLSCDAMVMPYRDGASLRRGTFMACLNHGRPTITTQPATPIPQLVHRQNIYLVPPESPEAIVGAVEELRGNAQLRATIRAGAAALSAEFTWDKIASQAVGFFEQVLADLQHANVGGEKSEK